jgi:hypothetical protein
MEKLRKLGAFMSMMWSIFFSKKFAEEIEKINFEKAQKVMDNEDKTDFVKNFIAFFNNGFQFFITERIANIWKSISIGGMKALKLMDRNKQKGFLLGNEAEFMTKSKSFKTSAKSINVDFAMKSLKDFGFTGSTFAEAQEFFRNHPLYEFCIPEDVYYLRIAYADQPKGQCVRLMMDTIADSFGYPRVFMLGRNDIGLWVGSDWCIPTYNVDSDNLWTVRIRK